jgi:hypothetical protein
MYRDYLEKYIISIIYRRSKRAFLRLYYRELSLIIRKGLIIYRKRRR